MKLTWTHSAWEDYLYWQKTDKKKLERINDLIKISFRTPVEGIGNPEALRHELQGYWSRRIDSEHRQVYSYNDDEERITIIACRYHY